MLQFSRETFDTTVLLFLFFSQEPAPFSSNLIDMKESEGIYSFGFVIILKTFSFIYYLKLRFDYDYVKLTAKLYWFYYSLELKTIMSLLCIQLHVSVNCS
ncbi:hypothetical protein PanWU01x14_247520, partial [Parasponia andersonii]